MKRIILVHGLPGSGKTTLADALAFKLGAARVNADHVRREVNRDLGFDLPSRVEHARRMAAIANITLTGAADFAVVDFVCPTQETRDAFLSGAQHEVFGIWMNTISEGRFANTNALYETPAPSLCAFTVPSYLPTPDDFAAVVQKIALRLNNTRETPRTYFVRYNTQAGSSNLRWRVIDAETMSEQLASDFRVEGTSMFAACSQEHGQTKWNVAVSAVAYWNADRVTFK